MNEDPVPILDYVRPQARATGNLAGWIVALTTGLLFGFLVSRSGFGFVCVGPVLGFVTGVATAMAANSMRLLLGLIGNAVASVSALIYAEIASGRGGLFASYSDLLTGFLVIIAFLGIPGLLGGLLGTLVRRGIIDGSV